MARRSLLHERGGQGAGVVVEEGDGRVVGGGPCGLLARDAGGPAHEVGVDGRLLEPVAQQLQHREGRGAAQHAVVAQPQPGRLQGRDRGERPDQVALLQPGPVRAAAVEGVRSVVRPVRALGGPGSPAEGVMGFEHGHSGARLGSGDGRGQSGETAADDGDAVHGWGLPRVGVAFVFMRCVSVHALCSYDVAGAPECDMNLCFGWSGGLSEVGCTMGVWRGERWVAWMRRAVRAGRMVPIAWVVRGVRQ